MKQKQALIKNDNDYTSLEKKFLKITKKELLDPFSSPPNIKLNKDATATVVIPGKNVEYSILSCLASIEQSSFNRKYPKQLEVIYVDDGSDDRTWEILSNTKFDLNLTILKQKHAGQAQALNTGISIAKNKIIMSCDADMILSYYTLEHLMIRHQIFPNVLLVGFRSDVDKSDIRVNFNNIKNNGIHKYPTLLTDERIVFPAPGFPENMCLASNHYKDLGNFKGLWMRNNKDPWLLSDLVFGALFSLSKDTYFKIGGYEERMVAYGCTDGYLASKAISVSNYVIPVYAASGLHISHLSRTSNKRKEYINNRRRFHKFIEDCDIDKYHNWLGKAKDRITDRIDKARVPTKNQPKLEKETIFPKYLQAETLLSLGKYKKAIAQTKTALTKDDKSLLILAYAYLGLKNYQEALNTLSKINQKSDRSLLCLLYIYIAVGNFDNAKKTLTLYLKKLNPGDNVGYWENTADYYKKQGELFSKQKFGNVARTCFKIGLVKDTIN